MIKLIFLIRRKPGTTHDAFCEYWLNKHGPLVVKHASTLKIRRYVQSHPIPSKPSREAHPGSGENWDGITEVWLDSLEVLAESHVSAEIQRVQSLLKEDEANFIDSSQSQMLITEEHELI